MFDIWNHKTNTRLKISTPFMSIEDAWAYVRAFYNTADYEVRDRYQIDETQAASDLLESNETTEIHFCNSCGLPMETVQQDQWLVVTCKNRSCDHWSVTLTTDQYAKLTEDEWQAYRESVARLKKTLGMEG